MADGKEELQKQAESYVEKVKESGHGSSDVNANLSSHHHSEYIPNNVVIEDRPTGDLAMEIDDTSPERLSPSYCAMPKSYAKAKCSGRTSLCRQVLNDSWCSRPTCSSGSTSGTPCKTKLEEYIDVCEDERFDMDVVFETNASTIRFLESVPRKMSRMSTDEVANFHLDDCLGGSSSAIYQQVSKRIYGDETDKVRCALKENQAEAVPIVLGKLKAMREERRKAQKRHMGAEEGDGVDETTNSGSHLAGPNKDAANHHPSRQMANRSP